MDYLLFAVYFIILCWLLPGVPFIKRSGISRNTIMVLFILKIIAGIAIGWLSLHYYNEGNDYWDLNREGWKEYQLLMSDPGEYFTNIFRSGYQQGYGGFFDSFGSFWNDLKNNLVIKMVSVFDLFSRGNYYINSLFFNFLIFLGHVALYRIFNHLYKYSTSSCIIGCFLLPSTLYFTSGIHRDGMVFLMLALLFYFIFFSLVEKRIKLKWIAGIIIAAVLLFLLRNIVFILLIPALLSWILSVLLKNRPIPVFSIVFLLSALLLFSIHQVLPSVDPLALIVKKQSEYIALPASATDIPLDTLQPQFKSFLFNAPQSMNHALLRPYIFELPSTLLLPMNIELLAYQLLFIAFLFFPMRTRSKPTDPFIYCAIFFTMTVFLFIGYMSPNLGTLVRYRSLYLPFIITPLLCIIDWERFKLSKKII